MSLEQIILIKNILLILLPVLLIIVLMTVDWKKGATKVSDAGNDFAGRILKKSKLNYFNYNSIQRYLNTRGATYMFGEFATPVTYILIKILLCLLLFMTGISMEGIFIASVLGSLGFFIPDILLTVSNNADNDAMLGDIKCIYDTLRIQTKAGVFLTASLSECYLAVRHRRLKSALLELTNDISTRRDIDDALERFNEKFDCGQIDIFCIVIRQSMESGRSVKVLEDLSLQMNDLQHTINMKEKEALDRKVQIIELLIFIGLLAVTVYSLGVEVMSSILIF
jgi:pilus assembly protein TadC